MATAAERKRLVVQIPAKLQALFEGPARYRVAHGGRGSAKSWSFARMVLVRCVRQPLLVLCTRELQISIRDSVHRLLSAQITALHLEGFFEVQQAIIRGRNGSEIIFEGLRSNVTKIKSLEGVDLCWVEEAQRVSEVSWEVLIPTIRQPGSEIWITFNRDQETDPTDLRFVQHPPPDAKVVQCNWNDNAWFPDELRREKEWLEAVDPGRAAHVYGGEPRVETDAQVLAGKCVVEPFEPGEEWQGPYQGMDHGFARDPAALVRCWVHDACLYIEYEAWGIGVELDSLGEYYERGVPTASRYPTRADNSRPETISYLRNHGWPELVAADKWPGSVEDGIAFLRQFKRIVIHERCVHTAQEARLYSYKVDDQRGIVLPIVVDAHNHCIDAVRYALQPMIRVGSFEAFAEFVELQVQGVNGGAAEPAEEPGMERVPAPAEAPATLRSHAPAHDPRYPAPALRVGPAPDLSLLEVYQAAQRATGNGHGGPTCAAGCGRPLGDTVVTDGFRSWHPECVP